MDPDQQPGGKRYEPTRTTRFYPAANLSEERKRQILELEIDPDEATFDDILFNTAAAYTGTFYKVMGMVEERWGKEAAEEIARQLGYRNGKANLRKWLKRHGVEEGSAELMSKFQDLQHLMRGPNHANAVSEYDERRAKVYRTRCGWHTDRPEGAESHCKHFSEDALRGYMEADPGIQEIRLVCCMSYGDDCCRHEFWYEEPDEPAGEVRAVYRREDIPPDPGA